MRECDNSKIHISNNSLLSICLLKMLTGVLIELLNNGPKQILHSTNDNFNYE